MNFKIVSSLVISSLLASPSFAADSQYSIFGSLGRASHDIPEFIDGSDTSFGLGGLYQFNENFSLEVRYDNYGEADQQASQAFALAIQDEVQLGIRAESGDNSVNISDTTLVNAIETTALSFGVIGGLPIGEQFNLYAKLGISFWDTDISADIGFTISADTVPAQRVSVNEPVFDDSGNDFYFGFGGKYAFTDNVSLAAEYTLLDIEIDEGGDYGIDNLSLQLIYSF